MKTKKIKQMLLSKVMMNNKILLFWRQRLVSLKIILPIKKILIIYRYNFKDLLLKTTLLVGLVKFLMGLTTPSKNIAIAKMKVFRSEFSFKMKTKFKHLWVPETEVQNHFKHSFKQTILKHFLGKLLLLKFLKA